MRYLEEEKIEKLCKACTDHLKPIVIVALNTGMRKGEILSLKWKDLDFKHKIIYVLDTKNGETKEIPMNKIVWHTLLKVRKHPENPWVFCKSDGKRYHDIKKILCKCETKRRNQEFQISRPATYLCISPSYGGYRFEDSPGITGTQEY